MKLSPPDAYWKKDVALFLSRRFALIIKMLYPLAIIVPVAASGIPARYGAAVVGIVAIMAGTFGAGESLTTDLNDGILASLVWVCDATFAIFVTLVAANCIGVFIANFTTSPADVLLYATAILFPLIYVSGFFRNQNPTGLLAALRDFVPFAYANDALKHVFGLATSTSPLETFVYPTLICAALILLVCLTAPRLLSHRL
jgi:ABC-2 type transport system permease protein